MLKQEINLYDHIEPPRVNLKYLNWHQFCLSNLVMLALFIIIGIFSFIDVLYLKNERAGLQAKNQQLKTEFAKRKNEYPSLFFSENVSQTISDLEKNLAMQEKLLNSLANNLPFSQDLLAFSRIIVTNVWLTSIKIENAGLKITVKGNALGLENLQAFLDNIAKENTFLGYTVNIDNIDNNLQNEKEKKLSFSVSLVKSS